MFKKLLILFAALLIALSMASNWQARGELQEMSLVSHLASYSHSPSDQKQSHDEDEDQDDEPSAVGVNHAGHHHHDQHRHSPGEPLHTHTHSDPGFSASAVQISLEKKAEFPALLPPAVTLKFSGNDRVVLHREISLVFRPPIS